MRRDDWLLQQLPVAMVEDDFLARFLRIFQAIADTELHQIDTLKHMFDFEVAPDAMVRLMGWWIGVDWIDSSLPDELQRRIVREYSDLIQWRGTARGLKQLLELISLGDATVEDSGGVHLETDQPPAPAHVRLHVESAGWATEPDLIRIVRAELPASVTFELFVGSRQIWPPQPDSGGEAQSPTLQVVS
jgi:phage tail-like protein